MPRTSAILLRRKTASEPVRAADRGAFVEGCGRRLAALPALWLIARVCWVALLVTHGVFLLRSLLTGGFFGQQLGLVLALGFFGLKVADWPALRIRVTARSLVACALIVALIHTGAVDRTLEADGGVLMWAALPAAAVVWGWWLCRLVFVRACLLVRDGLGRFLRNASRSFWYHHNRILLRADQCSLLAVRPPRAPPA